MKDKRTPFGKALDTLMAELWKKVPYPPKPRRKNQYPLATRFHFNHLLDGKSVPFELRIKPRKKI